MISLILEVITELIIGVVSLFPSIDLSDGLDLSGLSNALQFGNWLYGSTFELLFGSLITIFISNLAFSSIKWSYRKIPGVN